ncbi:MAG: hypothetical protein AAFP03_17410, partial [Cyanobacteria bacterium J06598_3]
MYIVHPKALRQPLPTAFCSSTDNKTHAKHTIFESLQVRQHIKKAGFGYRVPDPALKSNAYLIIKKPVLKRQFSNANSQKPVLKNQFSKANSPKTSHKSREMAVPYRV